MLKSDIDLEKRNISVIQDWTLLLNKKECTGCGKCEDICPVDAISIRRHSLPNDLSEWKTPSGVRLEYSVSSFIVDMGTCVECNICVEHC
ncbi:MAG: 4Fe-4S binding protein, partial [Bdellovibrionales bacterium]|nr:4Fe-4S binding protein [Bdellovibrionales bacterium]